jgi:hypothetical protein
MRPATASTNDIFACDEWYRGGSSPDTVKLKLSGTKNWATRVKKKLLGVQQSDIKLHVRFSSKKVWQKYTVLTKTNSSLKFRRSLLSYYWWHGFIALLRILNGLLWKWWPLLLRRRASLHCFSSLNLRSLPSPVVARTRSTPYLLPLGKSELRSVYDLAIYE